MPWQVGSLLFQPFRARLLGLHSYRFACALYPAPTEHKVGKEGARQPARALVSQLMLEAQMVALSYRSLQVHLGLRWFAAVSCFSVPYNLTSLTSSKSSRL